MGNPSETGTVIPADGVSPRAVSLSLISQKVAGFLFSEKMLSNAALLDPNNYTTTINGGADTWPVSVDASANPLIKLTYDYNFVFGDNVGVTVAATVNDSSSNLIDPARRSATAVLSLFAGSISIDEALISGTVSAAGSVTPITVAVRASNAAQSNTVTIETITAKTNLLFTTKDGVNVSAEYTVVPPDPVILGTGQTGWCTFTITKTGTTNGDIGIQITVTGKDGNKVETSDNTSCFALRVYTTASDTATQAQRDVLGNTLTVIIIPGNSMNTDALVLISGTASGTEAAAVIQANASLPSGCVLGAELAGTLRSINALALSDTSIHATFVNTSTITLTIYYSGAIPTALESGLRVYRLTGSQWVLVPGIPKVDTVRRCITVTVSGFSVYRLLGYSTASADLSGVIAYPNPYKPASFPKLKFDKLTADSTIRIYNSAGELVITITPVTAPKHEWDGTNQTGEPVASGVYFYVVTNTTGNKPATGKFVLIR